jgi:WD40 repeat protein
MCFSSCFDINLSTQENLFASAHFDGAIRLWSVRSGDLAHEIKGAHDDQVSCVRFTPDEKYIVSTGK